MTFADKKRRKKKGSIVSVVSVMYGLLSFNVIIYVFTYCPIVGAIFVCVCV